MNLRGGFENTKENLQTLSWNQKKEKTQKLSTIKLEMIPQKYE